MLLILSLLVAAREDVGFGDFEFEFESDIPPALRES